MWQSRLYQKQHGCSLHLFAHSAHVLCFTCWLHSIRLAHSLRSFPHGLVEIHKSVFTLLTWLTRKLVYVIVTGNTTWRDRDRDMRNKGKWDKGRGIQIKGNKRSLSLFFFARLEIDFGPSTGFVGKWKQSQIGPRRRKMASYIGLKVISASWFNDPLN